MKDGRELACGGTSLSNIKDRTHHTHKQQIRSKSNWAKLLKMHCKHTYLPIRYLFLGHFYLPPMKVITMESLVAVFRGDNSLIHERDLNFITI